MVARVGDDLFGPATINNFKSLGIGAAHVKVVKGCASGVAPIFVDSSGQNRIVVVKGANDRLLPRDVNVAAGLATTEPELEDVMRAMKASKLDILINVGFPRAMPYFFAFSNSSAAACTTSCWPGME